MAASDLGTLAPPGVELKLSDTWFDGNVVLRSGSTLTSAATASITLAGPTTFSGTGSFVTQAVNGTGTAPTAAAAANAGTGATATARVGHDVGGSFVLTAGTTPAAGVVATVTFGTALPAAPVSVLVTCVDTTASLPILMGAATLATTGFSIYAGALTATHTYLISYQVVAS